MKLITHHTKIIEVMPQHSPPCGHAVAQAHCLTCSHVGLLSGASPRQLYATMPLLIACITNKYLLQCLKYQI
jgi:hypothetical protein